MSHDHQSTVMLLYSIYKEADHETLNALIIFINRTQAGIIHSLHSCTENLLCSRAHTCTFIQLGICYLQDHIQYMYIEMPTQ